jgi:hypothetical protein
MGGVNTMMQTFFVYQSGKAQLSWALFLLAP